MTIFSPPRSAYLHVPFCRHRCGYCNFTVVAGRSDLQASYLDAIQSELEQLGTPQAVDTLYIGGGTPTELETTHLRQLLQLTRHWFPPAAGHEWSIEANPFDLPRDRLEALASAGVNRISLGVQSFDSNKLEFLERDHRQADIQAAYHSCRQYFPSVSLDLMFAVPGESERQWHADLRQAIELQPEHLSLYGLTFEKGARFWGDLARGELTELEDERQREMYELAIAMLTEAGWEHYEVSNFARPGHRCQHNEVYWVGDQYFAAGPGASRYVAGTRQTNHRSTFSYIRRVLAGQSPVAESETLSPECRAREQLVFGLRMLDGITRGHFAARTGFSLEQLVAEPLKRFTQLGLLADDGSRVQLTHAGLLISDAMWPEFL